MTGAVRAGAGCSRGVSTRSRASSRVSGRGPDREAVAHRVVRPHATRDVARERDARRKDDHRSLVEDVVRVRREPQPLVAALEPQVPGVGIALAHQLPERKPRLEAPGLDCDGRRALGLVAPANGDQPEVAARVRGLALDRDRLVLDLDARDLCVRRQRPAAHDRHVAVEHLRAEAVERVGARDDPRLPSGDTLPSGHRHGRVAAHAQLKGPLVVAANGSEVTQVDVGMRLLVALSLRLERGTAFVI